MTALQTLPAKVSSVRPPAITTFATPLGWMALSYRDDCLERLAFGHTTRAKLERALSISYTDCSEPNDFALTWVEDLRERILRFAGGEPDDFRDVEVSTAHLTPFAKRVVAVCRKIGWGDVQSYGEVARRAGRPGAARAIGNMMATNRVPLIVPCHRVVGSAGKRGLRQLSNDGLVKGLGGYSAPGGLATKRQLLELEGSL
ncbi:MAG: methylated-DNA--[protein]-cysteine S-methyltransferase [Aeoliella sp.]